jgi:hypothetical protein
MDDKTIVELQLTVKEIDTRSKADRFWFLFVAALGFSFLGLTNFVTMPREAQKQVKELMPEHAKVALNEWMKDKNPTLTVEELRNKGVQITSLETQARSVLQDLQQLRSGGRPWIAAELQNGWEHYGKPYATASYFRDALGMVHLRGLVKASQSTGRAVVFKLPKEYLPEVQQEMSVSCDGNVPCKMILQEDGSVYFETSSYAWLSLDGISFRATELQKVP